MIVIDRVYGKINIKDSLVCELLSLPEFKRLKYINQNGAAYFLDPKRDITRYEHSIGVWFLLKRFGASQHEQIAGLLHDIPHTAFSHVADFVFPNAKNTFHEQFTQKVILQSRIPQILKKYNIDVTKVLDKDDFDLLNSELPDLSADRIDYFLRDTRPNLVFPSSLIKIFLDDLCVVNNKFVFKSLEIASLYTILFLNADCLLWLDPNSVGSFYLLAGAIKKALMLQILTLDDLFQTDQKVFDILKRSKDLEIRNYITRLSSRTKFTYSGNMPEFFGPIKARAVDPYVKTKHGIKRVSDLIPNIAHLLSQHKNTYKTVGVSQITSS